MSPALGLLLGVMLTGGALLLALGLRRTPENTTAPTRTRRRRRFHLSRLERYTVPAAAAAGLIAALATGWLILLPLLPLTVLLLPRLLGGYGDKHRLELLEGLEKWTRALGSVLGAHGSLQSALATTLRGCPEVLRPATERLVARLRAGQSPQWSIQAWIDEIDDVTGDLIGATLLLSVGATDNKLRRILNDLAEQVAAQVRVRRQIEAERAGPIREARTVMILGTLILVGFVFFSDAGAFYLTGPGQLALVVVLAAFGLCLWGLKRSSRTEEPPRFMHAHTLEETIR